MSVKKKQPLVYDPDVNSPTIPKGKMLFSSNGEKSRECKDKKEFREKKEKLVTERLQYTQLLETHRSYFFNLLFTLSTYLAVMGACITIVCNNIEKIKKYPPEGSKTFVLSLVVFAVLTSSLFMKGLSLGEADATKRTEQVTNMAKEIGVGPVNVRLLEELFRWIRVGPMIIISVWMVVLIRGIMGYDEQKRFFWWSAIVASIIIALMWLGSYILPMIMEPRELFYRIENGITTIVWVWIVTLFFIGVVVAYGKDRHNTPRQKR